MSDVDLRVISLGAGVQSTCLYLMAVEGELWPRPDYAIFADTQDERPVTMDWLARLEERGDIPILRKTAGRLSDEVVRSMQETESGFCPIPTYVMGEKREKMGRRQCTRTHKIVPIYRAVRQLLGLQPGQRTDKRAEVWIGISTDEATRAKPSQYTILENRWPLLYDVPMSRGECVDYVRRMMEDTPPKSSCVYCPYRSDRDWITLKQDDPESFESAVQFERRIRSIDPAQFIHDTCTPLDQVDFEPDRTLDLFDNECEGMCGV